MAIVVVGIGGAGQSIAKAFADKYSFADVYAISDVRNLDPFFEFKDLERAIRTLEAYDSLILTAGLGGRGGDYLIKLVGTLDNIAAIFVCKPFRIEKQRVENAERQLSWLSLFKGKIFVKGLDGLFERMPEASLFDALKVLDMEIADEIAEFTKKLE